MSGAFGLMQSLLLVALLLEVGAASPLPVARATGPWVVDFEKTSCIASRDYDAAGTPVVLGIEAVPANEGATIHFQVPGKLSSFGFEGADLRVGALTAKENTLMGEPVTQPGHVRYSAGLTGDEYRALLADNRVSVRSPVVKGIYPVPSLAAVNVQLANCAAQMLEGLGLSRQAQARIARYAKESKGSRREDIYRYPGGALDRGAVGWVRIAVDVDAAGAASNCRVVRSSGYTDLDANACHIIEASRELLPAVDAQGHPVPSVYLRDIRYIIIE